MKILRIIARLNVGGPARHVIWLSKALSDDEFQTVLVAGTVPEGEADMSYFCAENGVEPVFINEMSRELSIRDVTALHKIYKEIKRYDPDIIHTHTAKAGTIGRLAAYIYRLRSGKPAKIVHTFHGHVFYGYYGALKTRFFLTVEKLLARFATDRIVVISKQQLLEINGRYGVGKAEMYRMVPLGIDFQLFKNEDADLGWLRREINARDDEMIVGFVGRLTEIKNISLLLRVASIHLQAGEPKQKLKFVIVGEGHLREKLESEANALGLDNTVVFLGHRSDVTKAVCGMDVVALTSRNEGTPLSLIEAMALGVPVISTEVGGVVDLLGETRETHEGFRVCERGIGVFPAGALAFYQGLIYLAKNEELRTSLTCTASEFVHSEYSVDRMTRDIQDLYRELLGPVHA